MYVAISIVSFIACALAWRYRWKYRRRRLRFLRQTLTGRTNCTSCGSQLKLVKGVYGDFCPQCGVRQA